MAKKKPNGFDVDFYLRDGDVDLFSIKGLKDGYCWPWECEK